MEIPLPTNENSDIFSYGFDQGLNRGGAIESPTVYDSAKSIEPVILNNSGNMSVSAGGLIVNSSLNNIYFGNNSGTNNSTGYHNTSIGVASMKFNTTGYDNVAIGMGALNVNTTGQENVAIGYAALPVNTTGTENVAIGKEVGFFNITGYDNIGIGMRSLYGCIECYHNVAVGVASLYSISEAGRYNTAVGNYSGYTVQVGISNVFIGYNSGYHASQKVHPTNSIAIGANTYTTANNQIVIGDTNITSTLIRGIANITTKTPANAGDAGIAGDICWDANYIYICVAANTWKKAGIATW